jgi:hypothetical protein
MKRIIGLAALVALLATLFAAAQASAQADEKELVEGWFKDRQVQYYDFGTNTPLGANNTVPVQPIWVFIHGMNADGTPDFVEGQHNIVNTVPGETGYSDLWQVQLVTVPEDYEPDSIRSAQELLDAGFEITPTEMLVNCPIVPEGTTLEGGEPLVQGWHDGEEVFYPDFGENPATTAPIWVLIHGMNPDGTPDFVEGQQNIIDVVPGDPGYSDFWRVNMVTVPESYEPNSIRSAQGVIDAGFEITQTDMVVNCPVTTVAGEPVAGGLPPSGSGPAGGGAGVSYWLIALMAATGAIATAGAGLAFARRRS